jgi:uncharacterized membrane protein
MDDLTIARAIHVLAVVHWMGGVAMVTAVILPVIRRFAEPGRRLALFEAVEGRFARQAKVSVTLAGLSGFYMAWRLDAWSRFADPHFWWMDAMVLIWAIFTTMLFVIEPLFLHARMHERAERDPDAAFRGMQRAHWVLLSLSAVTIAGAVLGAHGGF